MRCSQNRRAFTLIELLVVVAIISMLVAIFSVGTKKIRIMSFGLQQKSAFHAMRVGLELFSSDFDGYPDSARRVLGGPQVGGAQHLAEALLGRDGRGFEPQTGWYPPNDVLYRPNRPADLYQQTAASLARRKAPYCEIKYGRVLTIRQMWDGNNGGSQIYDTPAAAVDAEVSPVITDVFNRNDTPAGRVGMPVLYFKADPAKRFRVGADRRTITNPSDTDYTQWTYNFDDNLSVLMLPWLRDPAAWPDGMVVHYQDPDAAGRNPAQMFYEQITQTADADRDFYKPYNERSFLLISAGWDGIYGTKDDIVNFD